MNISGYLFADCSRTRAAPGQQLSVLSAIKNPMLVAEKLPDPFVVGCADVRRKSPFSNFRMKGICGFSIVCRSDGFFQTLDSRISQLKIIAHRASPVGIATTSINRPTVSIRSSHRCTWREQSDLEFVAMSDCDHHII